jgi:MFS family permease
MAQDRLITPSYCYMLAANFLLSFSFWLLIPVFPFYLSETFHSNNAIIGLVVSCYTISALCVRPFSGYLVDTFSRKPFYIFAYFVFASIFAGYLLAGTLTIFIILRLIQGGAFGMVSVGGNTIVIDIMPSSRRGEGLGYFGLTNNFAMSIGPMTGLFMHQSGISFYSIFLVALTSCAIGIFAGSMVCTPYKPPVKREPLSFDRFLLLKGIPAGVSLILLSIPYGMTTNYVALYAIQIGITAPTGLFFTFMAIGMAVSRVFSGKLVDKGKVTQVISFALYLVIITFFLLAFCNRTFNWNHEAGTYLFFFISLLLGIGFGIMFPAYNSLFVNLAPNSRRGTATSTYLTTWDIGISIGMILGGSISEISNFSRAYLFGAILTVLATIYFNLRVVPHYNKNKLR